MNKKIFGILILIATYCLAVTGFSPAATVDKIIVIVNGETITQGELDAAVASVSDEIKKESTEKDFTQRLEEIRKEILNRMIEERLILSEAKKKDIKVDDAEVEKKLKEVKSKFPSEAKFMDVLKAEDISLSELKQRYADQIRVSKLVDVEVRKKLTVTPSEISQYYEIHKADFKQPEQVKLKNILIKPGTEYEDTEAQALAEKILGFLKAGENFDEIALKYSKGPNADKGGELGFVKRGDMRQEIEEVIFNLDAGQFSEVIKTDMGYHIFKVEEKKPEGLKRLDEVKDDIEKFLYLEKGKKIYTQWIENLKKDAYISFR
ncbi:MAG: peptidylprolyl isomerase [Candidatus Omnitrophica bacterium]|nr:peptidylprolyl isomerase [Candidatus Omnitrophota bacterium]